MPSLRATGDHAEREEESQSLVVSTDAMSNGKHEQSATVTFNRMLMSMQTSIKGERERVKPVMSLSGNASMMHLFHRKCNSI